LLAALILLAVAAALTTLIWIAHDRSCVRLAPTVLNGRRWERFLSRPSNDSRAPGTSRAARTYSARR
jgi:hypothetical protein